MLTAKADIRIREDRIGRYFRIYLNEFIFAGLSAGYMEKNGVADIMDGVPVPLRKADIERFRGGEGVPPLHIAGNMAWVMGADPHFEHVPAYVAFLNRSFSGKIHEGMLDEGMDAADKGDFDKACVYFRAALCMRPAHARGMYGYAVVCRDLYLRSGDDEYIGRFKAEALDFFELITEIRPDFAQAYYYLGYAYLNIGLYLKAELAWKSFLQRSRNQSETEEIRERLEQIAEPVMIEQGCNMAVSGRFGSGLTALEPFMETKFKEWWPLSYHLGLCYKGLGMTDEALLSFKRVLALNGSHLAAMRELADIYAAYNDAENEEKYRKKIELINKSQ